MGTVQERGESRAYRLALNKRKAIVPLKWTRGASVAVDPGTRVNAHSAQPVRATRKRVLVYLQYLLWSFGDGLHFRRDRGICPDHPFSTSKRSPGVAALVRCQGNSWFSTGLRSKLVPCGLAVSPPNLRQAGGQAP